MPELRKDMRFALRALRSRPGFTTAAVLSLVLGIGVNTALFTLLDRIFWRPLPIREPDRLLSLFLKLREPSGEYGGERWFSYDNFRDFRQRNRSFTALELYQWEPLNLAGGDEPERVTGMFVTSGYFGALGIEPQAGRFFLAEENATPGSHPVAILGHGCWQRLFGGDRGVVGREVEVNGRRFTIVGIAPESFRGTELIASVDIWVPIMMFPEVSAWRHLFEDRSISLFRVFGRLRPGVTPVQAEEELTAIARALEAAHPKDNERQGAAGVMPLVEATVRSGDRTRYAGYARTLAIAVGLILLIACINVAHLLLVRGFDRRREIAVRRAVGASRGRIARQLLTETLVLFCAGGLLSLPVARGSLAILWAFRPTQFAADALDLGLDWSLLAFALAVSLATGLVFGLLPALLTASVDLVGHLRETARTTGGPGRTVAQAILVVGQVALALAALVGAGLFLRSLANAHRIELGFDAPRLALATVTPGDQGYEQPQAEEYYRRAQEALAAMPGIEAVGLSENRLLRGTVWRRNVYLPGTTEEVRIDGREYHRTNVVRPGFFAAVGIPLLDGNDFDDTIRADGPAVAIINETMARRLWPGERAVGQRFHFDYPSEPPIEVIGVVGDAKYRGLHDSPELFIYEPLAQRYVAAMTLHVRTVGEPATMIPTIREALREIDPRMPLADVEPMRHFVHQALWLERTSALLLGVFAGLAVVLAAVGVYGVVSYSVRQRFHELGIRVSLGAGRGALLRGVLRHGAGLVLAGVAIGWLLAFLGLRLLVRGQLHDVAAFDPATYGAVGLSFLAVALLASLAPARRAMKADPTRILRSE